jgi:TPR repeat protein
MGLQLLKQAADRGHSDAAFAYGQCVYKGGWIERKEEEGRTYLKKSMDSGNSYAENTYGVAMWDRSEDKGIGTAFIKRSANQGNAVGQHNLGFAYTVGRGVVTDLTQAAKCFEQSADQGNSLGLLAYGRCLVEGDGIPVNMRRGVQCVKAAADQGDPDARQQFEVYDKRLKRT